MAFSGNAEDAAAWLSGYEASVKSFDDEIKIHFLESNLGKDTGARLWWETTYAGDRTCWSTIRTTFLDRWGLEPTATREDTATTDRTEPQSTGQPTESPADNQEKEGSAQSKGA
jgi:hypothetical protein